MTSELRVGTKMEGAGFTMNDSLQREWPVNTKSFMDNEEENI